MTYHVLSNHPSMTPCSRRENATVRWHVKVRRGVAFSERLTGRLIRQWKKHGKGPKCVFLVLRQSPLTFRSLCTMPFRWQWFTLSRICCMQWLLRRPGQKQTGGKKETGKCQEIKEQEDTVLHIQEVTTTINKQNDLRGYLRILERMRTHFIFTWEMSGSKSVRRELT